MTRHDVEPLIAACNARAAMRGERLFPYQEDGARWLATRDTALLADAMGLGKTWQIVAAMPPRVQAMVVCPSAVKWPWAKTLRFLRPEYGVKIVESRNDWRFPRPGEVLVSGYEVLPPSVLEIDRALVEIADLVGVKLAVDRLPWDDAERERSIKSLMAVDAPRQHPGEWRKMQRLVYAQRRVTVPYSGTVLIADEAHRVKNPSASATARFRQLSSLIRARDGKVWLATGTPLKNRLEELWVVLQAAGLGREAFATSPDDSARKARGQFDIDALFPGRIAERLKRSGVMLRRERAEVLPDLPAKTVEVVQVQLDADTTRLADEIVLGLRAAGVDLRTATLDAIATAAMKSIPREAMSELRAKLAAAKIPAMLDLVEDLEDAGVPVVVFCDHLAALEHLVRREGWTKVTGKESLDEKERAIEEFQAGKMKGIAVSIRAGGVGITLTHAWRAIFVDLPWVPADLHQAEDRLCRIGQRAQGLLYTRLVAGHVLEQRIEELLEEKQLLFDKTITAAAVPGRRA